MKSAPYSITPVLFVVLLVAAALGSIVALILGNLGIGGILGFFLAAIIPFPAGGVARRIMTSALGSAAGVSGDAPTAASYAVRFLIAAVIAAGVAFVLSQASKFLPFGAASGALAALVTSMGALLVFALMTSRED